jgi:hypothetical protein
LILFDKWLYDETSTIDFGIGIGIHRQCIWRRRGLLLVKDLDPNQLNYDNYFTGEVSAKIKDFILLSKEEYRNLLIENGFVIQGIQKHLF